MAAQKGHNDVVETLLAANADLRAALDVSLFHLEQCLGLLLCQDSGLDINSILLMCLEVVFLVR